MRPRQLFQMSKVSELLPRTCEISRLELEVALMGRQEVISLFAAHGAATRLNPGDHRLSFEASQRKGVGSGITPRTWPKARKR